MKKNPARNVHLVKGPTNLLEKINLSIDVDSRLYKEDIEASIACLLYTSPSPRDGLLSRMPSSA